MNCKIVLEGWLKKQTSKDKKYFFHHSSQRWFKLQEVKGSDQSEFVLCYFKSKNDVDAKCWLYLNDVIDINNDEKSISVVSPARCITVEAPSYNEHLRWLNALNEYCPQIRHNFLKLSTKSSKNELNQSFGRSSSLFSRNADIKNSSGEPLQPQIESETQLNYVNSNDSQGNCNVDDATFSNVNRLNDSFDQYNLNNNIEGSLGKNDEKMHYTNDKRLENDTEKSFKETTAQIVKTKHRNNNNNEIKDHRLSSYRGSTAASAATNRLHQFISKETGSLIHSNRDSDSSVVTHVSKDNTKNNSNNIIKNHLVTDLRSSNNNNDKVNNYFNEEQEEGIVFSNPDFEVLIEEHNSCESFDNENLPVNDQSSIDILNNEKNNNNNESFNKEEHQKNEQDLLVGDEQAKSKSKIAPPVAPAPRKARDGVEALMSGSVNKTSRISIDEILKIKSNYMVKQNSNNNNNDDNNNDSSSSSDEFFRLSGKPYKKNKQKIIATKEKITFNKTKPPLQTSNQKNGHQINENFAIVEKKYAPTNGNALFFEKKALQKKIRAQTPPPKTKIDPGSNVDPDFLCNDWDDDDAVVADKSTKNDRKTLYFDNNMDEKKIAENTDESSCSVGKGFDDDDGDEVVLSTNMKHNVNLDSHWLNENFDDDDGD